MMIRYFIHFTSELLSSLSVPAIMCDRYNSFASDTIVSQGDNDFQKNILAQEVVKLRAEVQLFQTLLQCAYVLTYIGLCSGFGRHGRDHLCLFMYR